MNEPLLYNKTVIIYLFKITDAFQFFKLPHTHKFVIGVVLNRLNEIRVANLDVFPLNLGREIAVGYCLGNFIRKKMKFKVFFVILYFIKRCKMFIKIHLCILIYYTYIKIGSILLVEIIKNGQLGS